jgi:hypothetical protein
MKSALKGRGFCDTTDIIKNAKEEMKRISKIASRNVIKIFTDPGRSVQLHKGNLLKEIIVIFCRSQN